MSPSYYFVLLEFIALTSNYSFTEADSSISMLQADEKPDVSYNDIGGMDMQKQEMKEAVELPLTHFDLYKQVKTIGFYFVYISVTTVGFNKYF